MNILIVLLLGALVIVLCSGLFYTISYYKVENPPADAYPIVPLFIGSLYGLALFGLHNMFESRRYKHPYNYLLLFSGCTLIFISNWILEILYHQMYGR